MLANVLLCLSAATMMLLGCIHLVYTFRGNRFAPREAGLQSQMERVNLVITRQTTMWKAWLGFNASHSLGLMLFALVYAYLALIHPSLLFQSVFLLGIGLAMLLSLLAVAKNCWFSVPLWGISFALLSFVGSIVAYHI